MRLAIVLGTRPEIIKMAPVIRECQRRQVDYFVLHTGQHYSYSMDKVFFDDLELGWAEHNLEVGSGSHAVQAGRILEGTEKVFIKEQPDVVLVQGDTNTVMAAALAAKKLKIGVGHVEAGLRSFDRTMPEEINRVIADHISDYLFAPTEASRHTCLMKGSPKACSSPAIRSWMRFTRPRTSRRGGRTSSTSSNCSRRITFSRPRTGPRT